MSEDIIKGDKILEQMAATYRERNATYQNNYLKVGQILAILYPDGMQLKTADDFTRWHLVDWMVGKLTRFSCGNHMDSIHDLAVYAAMVEGWLKHEDGKRSKEKETEKTWAPPEFVKVPSISGDDLIKGVRTVTGLPV